MLLPHLPTVGRRQGGFTWRRGQRHVHKVLVVLVELCHLNLVKELPMAVDLAAETVGWNGQ